MKDSDITGTYRRYRSSHRKGREYEIQNIVSMACHRTAATKNSAMDQEEERVTALFKIYQQQRDPHRDEILEKVMDAARERIQLRKKRQPENPVGAFFNASRQLLEKLRNKLFTAAPVSGWRIAAPALVLLVAVVLLSPQLLKKDVAQWNYADNGIPPALIEQASQLTSSIQRSPAVNFGFSTTTDPTSIAFKVGIITTDLYILDSAGQLDRARKIAQKIPQIVRKDATTLPLLSSLDKLNSLNSKQVRAIGAALEQRYAEDKQQAMFLFGKWLEATLLATTAVEKGAEPELLSDLLAQWQKKEKQGTLQLSPATAKLVTGLNGTTLSTPPLPGEIRKLQQQLIRIKAALQ